MTHIEFTISRKTPSVANLREHWAAKAKRTKTQRAAAMLKCPRWTGGPLLVVTLTRVAPRALDTDNAASALKAYRDGIASRLGVDDRSPLIEWRVQQEKGEPAVRVVIRRASMSSVENPDDDRETPDSSPAHSPKKGR